MLSKITIVAAAAIFFGTTAGAIAQGYPNGHGNRYGGYGYETNGFTPYTDRYGLGYSNSARHDPRDTNGF